MKQAATHKNLEMMKEVYGERSKQYQSAVALENELVNDTPATTGVLATDEDWFKHRHWVDHPDGSTTREPIVDALTTRVHTATPWKVHDDSGIYYVVAPEIALVATLDPSDDDAPAEANAAFIVKAVNNHDALVAALRAVPKFLATLPPTNLETEKQNRRALTAMVYAALSAVEGE